MSGRERDAELFARIDETLSGHELQRTTEWSMQVDDAPPPFGLRWDERSQPPASDSRVTLFRAIDFTGQTDQTEQIQAWFDAGAPGHLPPGTYRVSRTINVTNRSFTRIDADGATFVR